MKVHVNNYAIATLVIPHMYEKINFDPDYQRGLVWNEGRNQEILFVGGT